MGEPDAEEFLCSLPGQLDPTDEPACLQALARVRKLRDAVADAGPGRSRRSRLRCLACLAESRIETWRRRIPEAFEATMGALRAMPPDDADLRASVNLCLARLFLVQGDAASALGAFERARVDMPARLAFDVEAEVASALRRLGRLEEAAARFDDLLDGTTDANVPPRDRAAALMNAASCDWQVGRFEKAIARLDRALALKPVAGIPELSRWDRLLRAWIRASQGDSEQAWTDALAAAREPWDVELHGSAARLLSILAFGDRPSLTRVQIPCLEGPDLPERRRIAMSHLTAALARAEVEGRLGAQQELLQALVSAAGLTEDLAAEVKYRRALDAVESRLSAASQAALERRDVLLAERAHQFAELDQLRARERLLAESNVALAAVDADRVRLLRTVAHDLRNPLTAIVGALELAEAGSLGVEELIDTVAMAATRMQELLEQALSPDCVRRGQAGQEPVVCSLNETIEGAVETFSAVARCRGQSITCHADAGGIAQVDAQGLVRILENLVANALKYAPKGGRVDVCAKVRSELLEIDVIDDGPGFPGLHADDGLLFGHQLAARDRTPEAGWGIGLHTVYQLVARQGGVIALGNRPEGGAHVRVRLPVILGSPAQAPAP